MKSPTKHSFSLQARFGLATLLSFLAFAGILLIMIWSFVEVRYKIRDVVGVQFEQTVAGSLMSREIGQFAGRLQLLEATFWGRDDYLQREGQQLLDLLQHPGLIHSLPELTELQRPLAQAFVEFLQQAKQANKLLLRLSTAEEGLDENLVILEELAAEQLVEAVRQRQADVEEYIELGFLIAGYRVALLDIVRSDEFKKLPRDTKAALSPSAAVASIETLISRLTPLTEAAAPVDELGRHLIDQLRDYQLLRTRFHQQRLILGQNGRQLHQLTDAILKQLAELDQDNAAVADRAGQEIDRTILSTGSIVLVLLVVLALVLGLIQLHLYSHHLQAPMEKIRRRLLRFQEGDYRSPMVLQRDDEWGEIEDAFNNMLTDLVKSWSAVQESERRYRGIFNSAAVGIFQTDPAGNILRVNPTLARMLKIDSVEDLRVLGSVEQFYAIPEQRRELIEVLRREKTFTNFELKMRRSDGETFWAAVDCHLVFDNNQEVAFIEGTVDDISLQRQAEKRLRELQEYLYDIVNAMPAILIGVDQQLRVTLWNRQVSEISGIPVKEAVGKPLEDVFNLIEADTYLAELNSTLLQKTVTRLRKITGCNRGSGHFYDLLIYPLSAPTEVGAVIYMEDISDKVQIEEVMVQSEKMLSVGSLAAGMAHEINNPLASVLQNLQVMEQRLSPALSKNQQVAEQLGLDIEQVAAYARERGFFRMIDAISEAGQRAARIIENMLNFSRKSSSNFLPCALAELVEKTLELASSDYEMKHNFDFRTINIVREFEPVPDVPCEPGQIQQVIFSLLKNAAQAIASNVEKPEIRIRIFQQEENVGLQIEDNGPGMDSAVSRRIFEPFFTTKEVGIGTGLGLSVAYFLVTDNHHGQLNVSSAPGEGSCFTILLPLKRKPSGE